MISSPQCIDVMMNGLNLRTFVTYWVRLRIDVAKLILQNGKLGMMRMVQGDFFQVG